MLFKLEDISLDFKDKILFEKINLTFNKGDKLGIIGDNGVGKTSIFNILLNKINFTGKVLLENKEFGVLFQNEPFEELKLLSIRKTEIEDLLIDEQIISDTEKYNELLEEYNDLVSSNIQNTENILINKFKFNQNLFLKEKKEELSGGEFIKLKLIKLFSKDYDYFLLDEPTNHLDINSKKALMKELNNKESYILISHDIELLNNCCNKILEIKNCLLTEYIGNYDLYLEQKEKERDGIMKTQKEHKNEKNKIMTNITNLKNWGSKKMANKTNHLHNGQVINNLGYGKGSANSGISDTYKKVTKFKEKLNSFKTPELEKEDKIKIKYLKFIKPNRQVLKLSNLEKSFESFKLNINKFELESTEKIALQGANGCGKSSLLKLIIGELEPETGSIEIGNKVEIGYLSQKNENLNLNNSVLKEILNLDNNLNETEIRKYLGKFLFKKNDVFKIIKNLSGGEKIRLALLKLILQGNNFLILDEPTNHLDISSKLVLSDALKEFPGAILVVSHDNEFLDKFVTKKIEMNSGSFV